MNFLKKAFVFLSVLSLLTLSVLAHTLTTPYDWYFKKANDHSQPSIFLGNSFHEKYGTLYMGDKDEKVVYLTFDAGYGNPNLIKILDILKEKQVPGAFFILPEVAEKHTEVAKRMSEEGHIVANHSYSHKDMTAITDREAFIKELTELEDLYADYTGYEMSKYFRPPSGRFSEQNLLYAYEAGYIPTFWSFAYQDWDNNKQMPPDKAKKIILDNVHNGMVMLLHPNSETNSIILGEVIDELKQQGYSFGTLDQLKETQKAR